MKSIALLAVGASLAFAQSLNDLPPCGQLCVNNMIQIAASQFGCAVGNVSCYCTNQDFGYGIRDCSNQACTAAADAQAVQSFGLAFCARVASATPTLTASPLSVLSSALQSATATPTGGAAVSSVPITTSPLVATVSASDTTYVTTTGFTTIYSGVTASAGASVSSALSSARSSASSALSSVAASASSVATSLASSAASRASSLAASASSAAGSLASGATGSATSTGGAPMKTAAPLLGAVGVAALLFI